MKNRTPLPPDVTTEPTELAEVRASVQRALATTPPDLGALTTALERVDALIAQAQGELIAAVRELQSAVAPSERALSVRVPVPVPVRDPGFPISFCGASYTGTGTRT